MESRRVFFRGKKKTGRFYPSRTWTWRFSNNSHGLALEGIKGWGGSTSGGHYLEDHSSKLVRDTEGKGIY